MTRAEVAQLGTRRVGILACRNAHADRCGTLRKTKTRELFACSMETAKEREGKGEQAFFFTTKAANYALRRNRFPYVIDFLIFTFILFVCSDDKEKIPMARN